MARKIKLTADTFLEGTFYTSVTEIGLTVGSATIAGAWAALPKQSMLICAASDFTAAEVPAAMGSVEMAKQGTGRGWIDYHGKDGTDYRMGLNGSGAPDGTWVKVTTVGSFKVYTAESSEQSVGANAPTDFHISFSAFGSTGVPIGLAGFSVNGAGVSQATIYRAYMDTANSEFIVSARNRDSSARTLRGIVNALFLE